MYRMPDLLMSTGRLNPSRLVRIYRRASFSDRGANGREARFTGTSTNLPLVAGVRRYQIREIGDREIGDSLFL